MIKQFVPSDFCLKCTGCCRFKEQDSVWAPCLLEEEIQELLDKEIPAASLHIDKRIHLIPNPQGDGFLCPFLNPQDNQCRIYDMRPLECRLYPFLIALRNNKILLTVDPNCPYVEKNLSTKEFKEYSEYLTKYLNAPAQINLFKTNPQLLMAYQQVLDIAELGPADETK